MTTRPEIPEMGKTAGSAAAEDLPAGEAATAARPAAAPRAYSPPRLEALGRLAEMTRFGGSDIVDSGGGLGPQPG